MNKEIAFTIQKEQNGLPLKTVLSKEIGLSRREISRLKFQDGLKVNGESARVTQQLHTGDQVVIHFSERDSAHAVRIMGTPDILYEDEDVVVVYKPTGMVCHPSKEHRDDDMGTLLQNYYQDAFTVRPVGRLDKEVSGIMLYAKNQISAARLSRQRNDGRLHKEYVAFVKGTFAQFNGTLTYALKKSERGAERKVSSDGQQCVTDYEVLEAYDDYSLVKISIRTGRTHQIRAGMSHFSHPLLGDRLYGGSLELIERTALHCAYLRFTQPFSDEVIEILCDLPEDMAVLKKRPKPLEDYFTQSE